MDFSLLSDLWAISRTIPAETATHQQREGGHGELHAASAAITFPPYSTRKSPEIKKTGRIGRQKFISPVNPDRLASAAVAVLDTRRTRRSPVAFDCASKRRQRFAAPHRSVTLISASIGSIRAGTAGALKFKGILSDISVQS